MSTRVSHILFTLFGKKTRIPDWFPFKSNSNNEETKKLSSETWNPNRTAARMYYFRVNETSPSKTGWHFDQFLVFRRAWCFVCFLLSRVQDQLTWMAESRTRDRVLPVLAAGDSRGDENWKQSRSRTKWDRAININLHYGRANKAAAKWHVQLPQNRGRWR